MRPYVIGMTLLVILGVWYIAQATGWRHPTNALVVQEESVQSPSKKPAFIPADSFQGSRPGYVYKMDTEGLGYYIDY